MKKLSSPLTKQLLIQLKQSFKEFLTLTFISTGVIILIFWLIGQPLEISGDSMTPTLLNGEHIIIEKLSIKNTLPKRGEIYVVRHPDNNSVFVIKRAIGLPGDKIKLSNGNVYINEVKVVEPYLANKIKTSGKTFLKDDTSFLLPTDSYFFLGDNRENSADSRTWGTIKLDKIIGKPVIVYYPWENFRIL